MKNLIRIFKISEPVNNILQIWQIWIIFQIKENLNLFRKALARTLFTLCDISVFLGVRLEVTIYHLYSYVVYSVV